MGIRGVERTFGGGHVKACNLVLTELESSSFFVFIVGLLITQLV